MSFHRFFAAPRFHTAKTQWRHLSTNPASQRISVERRGQYRKATLIERHGPNKNMVDLRLELAEGCPKIVVNRLDEHPEKMRQRRETVEHPFGTMKARMGATHFLMKTLPRVASEMALHVLAYNMTRVMSIMGIRPLMAAMRA